MLRVLRHMSALIGVLAVVGALFFAFGQAGVASADHDNGAWSDVEDQGDAANAPHWSPVGSTHLSPAAPGNVNPDYANTGHGAFNGAMNGFGVTGEPGAFVLGSVRAGAAINNNPNCPLHWDPAP